jgi:hypothetical protein
VSSFPHPFEESLLFHFKLIELESELLAKELAEQIDLTIDCEWLLKMIEGDVGIRLGDRVTKGWKGWLTFRRGKSGLVICRGRAFTEGHIFVKEIAGLDVSFGLDAVMDYKRGFDVTPPQELDHLLVNFKFDAAPHILVWYGENIAPYQLFFDYEASPVCEEELREAIAEGCVWILKRPKAITLTEYLRNASLG